MWVTLVRPPGLSGPAVSCDVGVPGDGAAFGSVDPEERERRRTPPCDLTEEIQSEQPSRSVHSVRPDVNIMRHPVQSVNS